MVVGDAEKIRTIVDNLVSNAIKYSPRSGAIAVDARRPTTASRCSTSSITGPASTRSERERIFESFYQGKAARRRPRQGLGPRARDRARIRAGARRAHRGPRSRRRRARRAFPAVAAARRWRRRSGERGLQRTPRGHDWRGADERRELGFALAGASSAIARRVRDAAAARSCRSDDVATWSASATRRRRRRRPIAARRRSSTPPIGAGRAAAVAGADACAGRAGAASGAAARRP